MSQIYVTSSQGGQNKTVHWGRNIVGSRNYLLSIRIIDLKSVFKVFFIIIIIQGFNFLNVTRMTPPKADSTFMLKEPLSKCHAPIPASVSGMHLRALQKQAIKLSLCKVGNFVIKVFAKSNRKGKRSSYGCNVFEVHLHVKSFLYSLIDA